VGDEEAHSPFGARRVTTFLEAHRSTGDKPERPREDAGVEAVRKKPPAVDRPRVTAGAVSCSCCSGAGGAINGGRRRGR
jgi:hypothetical protein